MNGEGQASTLTRRSLLRSSVGLAAAGALARPYIAHAAATTVETWWNQGFIPEEDAAFRAMAPIMKRRAVACSRAGSAVDLHSQALAALQMNAATDMAEEPLNSRPVSPVGLGQPGTLAAPRKLLYRSGELGERRGVVRDALPRCNRGIGVQP